MLFRVARHTLLGARWCLRGGPLQSLFDDNFPGAFDHHQCIFIHIPKTAGSTVSLSLFGHQVGHRRYIDFWRENKKKTNSYFKFTFVRNPWDRLVSAYHFLRAGGMSQCDRAWAENHLVRFACFDDFVKGWVDEVNVRRKEHFRPQHSYLVGIGSRDVKVDFVGRVENFSQDFQSIANRLGVTCEPLTVNKSKHEDYRSYYSEESVEIVRRVYERDVILFGYEFDKVSGNSFLDIRATDCDRQVTHGRGVCHERKAS